MAQARACFEKADFSVINLETVFGNREEYTPICKSGPNQIFSPEFLKCIEFLAPSAAGLANNHVGDFGEEPLLNTLKILTEMGVRPFGAGKNTDAAYQPVLFDRDGSRVAVIGVCENEFGTAKEEKAGSAGFSLGRVTASIRSAISKGYVPVVFFHGGNEHCPFPSPSKKELYRHFVDIGAGAVIAMHTPLSAGIRDLSQSPDNIQHGELLFSCSALSEKTAVQGLEIRIYERPFL